MTDEQMDARLRAAGARWRTATNMVEAPPPAEVPHEPPIAERPARRRWPLLASAAVIAAALVIGGTFLLRGGSSTPRPSGDVAGLQGHVWLLTGVPGVRSTATLYIGQKGQLVADDECRLIGAHASVHGSSLTVSGAVIRDKSCTDQYTPGFYRGAEAFLTGRSTFRISSDALTITSGGRADRFVLAPQQTPVPTTDFPTLQGDWWRLTDATDVTGRAVTVPANQNLRLDQGKINGSMGCQKFGARARITGDRVTIGQYFVPAISCAASPAAAVLTGTVRATVVGAQLTITKGQAKLVYRWLPDSPGGHEPAAFENRTWYLDDAADTGIPIGTSLTVSAAGDRQDPGVQCNYAVDRLDVEPGALYAISEPGGVCVGFDPLDKLWTGGWQAWSIQNGRLLVFGAAQADPIVFSTTPPPAQAATLTGTWDFVVPGASMAVQEQFTVAGHIITITHRCYSDRGTVSVTGNALQVSGVHLYRALPCPQRPATLAASERIFDTRLDHLLGGTATWTLERGTLTVSAQGVPAMTFERAPRR